MHVLQAVSAFEVSTQIEGMAVLQMFVEHGRIEVGEGRLGRTRWAWAVTLQRMSVAKRAERIFIGSVLGAQRYAKAIMLPVEAARRRASEESA